MFGHITRSGPKRKVQVAKAMAIVRCHPEVGYKYRSRKTFSSHQQSPQSPHPLALLASQHDAGYCAPRNYGFSAIRRVEAQHEGEPHEPHHPNQRPGRYDRLFREQLAPPLPRGLLGLLLCPGLFSLTLRLCFRLPRVVHPSHVSHLVRHPRRRQPKSPMPNRRLRQGPLHHNAHHHPPHAALASPPRVLLAPLEPGHFAPDLPHQFWGPQLLLGRRVCGGGEPSPGAARARTGGPWRRSSPRAPSHLHRDRASLDCAGRYAARRLAPTRDGADRGRFMPLNASVCSH
ncbi:hypothetical protein B0H17DRAFT_184111 [Mycena rosella]|uniref:Uncharacterized protein n=1 Tax=Mycena rosella TaxID=1033263 RepID=A0AAD7CZY9_MYCRO|nr:hypothetical protein B0H17DRAFT_184111 [Mycena rosella]